MPCALMLDLAEALDPLLNRRAEQLEKGLLDDEDVGDTTLQLVFFDGEEAFKDWTHTDSVYGARSVFITISNCQEIIVPSSRHLAEKWSSTYLPPHSKRRLSTTTTELGTIEHLILLDLLGAKDPRVQSFFLDTAWLFDKLVSSEKRLSESGVLGLNAEVKGLKSFFVPRVDALHNYGFIEDDHVPFMQRGVSILHVITNPFPKVWHRLSVRPSLDRLIRRFE